MSSAASENKDGVATKRLPTAGTPSPSRVVRSQPITDIHAKPDSDSASESQSTSNGLKTPQHEEIQLGSECAIQTLYEGPPKCDCCKNWVEEYPEDLRTAVEEQEETKQKALVVRMRKKHGEGRALELDSVVIQSASLKKTLGEVFEGYQGITPSLKKLVFREPFRPFFYRWARLKKVLQRQKLEDPESAGYTQLLYDVLHSELRDKMAEIDDLVDHRVITYPLLWALFEPGSRITAIEDGQPVRFFIVEKCGYHQMIGFCNLSVMFVDWDGQRLGYAKTTIRIPAYSGTRNITELNAMPASFCPSREEREASAIARGRLFMDLRGFHHVGYSGLFQQKIKGTTVERQVDGRIVVDAASYFENNTLTDPKRILFELGSTAIVPQIETQERSHVGETRRPSSLRGPARMQTMLRGEVTRQQITEDGEPPPQAQGKTEHALDLTDEQLLLCNTHVRGYSLKLKKWGAFEVTKVREIAWNDAAFPNLMLPGGYKDLILSFVEGQASPSTGKFDDLIEGKGLGLVMLLAGNPGTGKTLTAEAVADKVRRPLYVLSAGELGQTAEKLEERLSSILKLTEAWDAVLLFDECDVFLQQRSHQNLSHNEVVAVFLRLLEYYRGILFMTTNRADSIDRAFKSRVHLTLQYPDLAPDAKEHIWRQFIAQSAGSNTITEETYARLAQLPVNGRQIKNVVKSATLLAAQQKTSVGTEQIRIVLGATGEAVDVDI